MKKIFLAVTMAIMALTANAQSAKKGDVNVGISAGAGFTVVNREVGFDPAFHYQLGGVVDFGLADNFYLETGLTAQVKRYRFKGLYEYIPEMADPELKLETPVTTLSHQRFGIFYLSIPALFAYKFDLGSVSLAPQVGPVLNIAVSGSSKEDFGDGASHYSTFEMGGTRGRVNASGRMGLCLGFGDKLRLGFGYDMGFGSDDSGKISNKLSNAYGTITCYFNSSKSSEK